ncbi:MAG: hypothetical protein ACO3UM_17430, partial [Planctomycetota bacterium]
MSHLRNEVREKFRPCTGGLQARPHRRRRGFGADGSAELGVETARNLDRPGAAQRRLVDLDRVPLDPHGRCELVGRVPESLDRAPP